jgi:hypothetical protein
MSDLDGVARGLPDEGTGWVAALDPSSGAGASASSSVGRDARRGYGGRLLVGHVERFLPQRGKTSRRSRSQRDLWVDTVLDSVAEVVHRFAASVVSDAHIPAVIEQELGKRAFTA